ncbi:uncharacterized protein LOC116244777 isoform X4 [Nymphaea colorata]|uniref:uncharacterized protein LOC116244777 isoform X4 n=1 Tax=Nymphaea colorata TaxID=210225 RepID=UPI00214E2D5D|nr:uncharacterized protein LOC116244777 isoform X4 [Nymphaea colorata]
MPMRCEEAAQAMRRWSGVISSVWAAKACPLSRFSLPAVQIPTSHPGRLGVFVRLQGILCVQVPTSSMSHNFVDPVLMTMWTLLEALLTPQMFLESSLVCLDNAATSQKPYAVLEVLRDYVRATAQMVTTIFIT